MKAESVAASQWQACSLIKKAFLAGVMDSLPGVESLTIVQKKITLAPHISKVCSVLKYHAVQSVSSYVGTGMYCYSVHVHA